MTTSSPRALHLRSRRSGTVRPIADPAPGRVAGRPVLSLLDPRFRPAQDQHLVHLLVRYESFDQCQGLLKADAERHEYIVVPPHRALALMDQVPQSKIEKAGGTRRHAVSGTALDAQAELREERRQPRRLVAPAMADEVVEGRPTRLMQRHRDQQRAARR